MKEIKDFDNNELKELVKGIADDWHGNIERLREFVRHNPGSRIAMDDKTMRALKRKGYWDIDREGIANKKFKHLTMYLLVFRPKGKSIVIGVQKEQLKEFLEES